MKEKRVPARRFCAVFLMFCILSSILFIHSPAVEAEENNEPYIVVSLGDSYASGEGVPPFYYQDLPYEQKVDEKDWIAHRSELSWSGKLQMPYLKKPLSDYKGKYWFFEANSGAKTAEIVGGEALEKLPRKKNSNIKEYYIKKTDPPLTGTTYLQPQIEIFDSKKIKKGSVRYVTISIGGNDAGFSTAMEKVIKGSVYLNFNSVETYINQYYENNFQKLEAIKEKLEDTYRQISEAAGPQATILVAGYPYLLDPSGTVIVVEKKEAKCVNEAVRTFNIMLYLAVKECHDDDHLNIEFVPVADQFEGHEAYSKVPYLNDLIIPPQSEDYDQDLQYSCYSFHPNKDGIGVYASCFQEAINKLEKNREQPYILEDNVDWFLNRILPSVFHSRDFIVDHRAGDVSGAMDIIRGVYGKLHEMDKERYPLESIGYWEMNYTLSSEDLARAKQNTGSDFWIDYFTAYDYGAVQDVLDVLYGKGKMTPELFFGRNCFVTSDGYLLLTTFGTDVFLTGDDRYKIRDMQVDGDDITVTVNSICVNYDFKYDMSIGWDVPDYGSYNIYDLVTEKRMESGHDDTLKEGSDYGTFADRYIAKDPEELDSLGFRTEIFYLYRDEDGIHLR